MLPSRMVSSHSPLHKEKTQMPSFQCTEQNRQEIMGATLEKWLPVPLSPYSRSGCFSLHQPKYSSVIQQELLGVFIMKAYHVEDELDGDSALNNDSNRNVKYINV